MFKDNKKIPEQIFLMFASVPNDFEQIAGFVSLELCEEFSIFGFIIFLLKLEF